jgi:hypothetical protein
MGDAETSVATAEAQIGHFPEDIYLPAPEIPQALERPGSRDLVREVLRFVRPPSSLVLRLLTQPLILFRHIATPNLEQLRFLAMAKSAVRPALILEMPNDWFTPTVNASKRRLGKLTIQRAPMEGRSSGVRSIEIVSFNQRGRHRLRELVCHDGTPLVSFHHQMLGSVAGEQALEQVIDNTDFHESDAPRVHYERLFALTTCLGLLVESFATSGAERAFTEQVILPAIEASSRRFGVKPRIVRLLPVETEADPFWESYPPEVMPFARQAARRCVRA